MQKNTLSISIKNFYKFIFFACVVFLFSCEFQPSEILETIVEKPAEDAPNLLLEVQPNMDTLKLATDVWAEFKLTSQETNVKWVKVFFDNKVVYDFEYNPQSLPRFFIALDSYVNGLHQFTIQAFTSSNTGSIADKMGVEGYLYETVWPVLIKHNIEPRVAIKNVQFKNGSAIINWEKYDYYGFQSYNFNKYSSIEGNKFNFVIHNPYLNGVVDTSYIEGEYAGYRVKLNNLFSSKYYNFYVAIDPPVVSLLNNGILNVEWSKSQNKKIFGSYYVTVKAPKGGKNEEFKTNLIENTSTTFLTPGFGDSYEIQVRYVPKTFTGPYLNFNSAGGRTSYSMGNTMPKFEKGMEIGSTGNVLLFNQGKFYKYSILNNLVIDSFEVADLTNSATIRISPKGEYFCYFTYNKFVLRETATWNMVNSFNVPFLNNGNLELRSVSISDKYQLVVVDHFNTLKVVDISTGTELYRKTSSPNEFIQMAVVNSEADRILYKIRIYSENENYLRLGKFNGLEISPIGETTISTSGTNYNVSQFAFIDNQVLLLKNIASYNYSWEVRNIEDFALIKSIELPKKFVPVAIDFNNLKLVLKYGYSGGYDYSYLVDLESKILQQIYPIIGNKNFVFAKGLLCNGTGRYLPTNDLIIQK